MHSCITRILNFGLQKCGKKNSYITHTDFLKSVEPKFNIDELFLLAHTD